MSKYKLESGLRELGVPENLIARASEKMLRYMELLLAANEHVNLTADTDPDEFIYRHLLDSVCCYGWTEIENAKKIVDIGTGAGLPGIPLAILYPERQFVLIDSLRKRIDFIDKVVSELSLSSISALHLRAEDAGQDKTLRENFDLCVSRALAPLPVLLEYGLPLVKLGGSMYAYKTQKAEAEIKESEAALKVLGAKPTVDVKAYTRGQDDTQLKIFIIKKSKYSPKRYPRKSGTASTSPIV
jgi:16S rRNA (guanine527-N7)-methyltransferase